MKIPKLDTFNMSSCLCFKGNISSEQDMDDNPQCGWNYRIEKNGIYKGHYCREGDLLFYNNEHKWVIFYSNLNNITKKKKVYLASPYSSSDLTIMEKRCNAVQQIASKLMMEEMVVFAPIAHSHGISQHLQEKFRTDFEFWMEQDLSFLDACDELYVLQLDGWKESKGVQREIEFARKTNKIIRYLDSEGNEVSKELLGKTF